MPEIAIKTRQYEALFLFGTGAGADVAGTLDAVRSLVERHGGEILLLKKWDERRLAYEVGKQKRGLYVLCFFRGPTTANSAITREVNLSETILRVLITDADHLSLDEMEAMEPQQPAPREQPGDRGGPGGFDRGFDRGFGGDRAGDRGGDRAGDRGREGRHELVTPGGGDNA